MVNFLVICEWKSSLWKVIMDCWVSWKHALLLGINLVFIEILSRIHCFCRIDDKSPTYCLYRLFGFKATLMVRAHSDDIMSSGYSKTNMANTSILKVMMYYWVSWQYTLLLGIYLAFTEILSRIHCFCRMDDKPPTYCLYRFWFKGHPYCGKVPFILQQNKHQEMELQLT